MLVFSILSFVIGNGSLLFVLWVCFLFFWFFYYFFLIKKKKLAMSPVTWDLSSPTWIGPTTPSAGNLEFQWLTTELPGKFLWVFVFNFSLLYNTFNM